jgi:hypothetical protein
VAGLAVVATGIVGALGAAVGLELFGSESSRPAGRVAPAVERSTERAIQPAPAPPHEPRADTPAVRPDPEPALLIETPAVETAEPEPPSKRKRANREKEPPGSSKAGGDERAWGEPIEPY